ncbi:hypothetical protein F4809DRAFT_591080 [Biscogniauxia mediterranea]|nr:hypothetical protein F4809DRAFT_591080 [Biscogniauxia mediterranea]
MARLQLPTTVTIMVVACVRAYVPCRSLLLLRPNGLLFIILSASPSFNKLSRQGKADSDFGRIPNSVCHHRQFQ